MAAEPIRLVLVEDNQVFREALELLLGLRSDIEVVASSAAAGPSATDATTSMSERSPSRSSSASRKSWLSSTRTRRIGSGIRLSLFRRQEQCVVRLSAGLDVELEL